MLRFRRIRSLQKFAAVHATVHNHFKTEPRSPPDQTTRHAVPPLSPNGAAFSRPDIGARLANGDQFAFV